MRNGNEIINPCIIEFFFFFLLLLLEPRSLIALKIFYSGLQLKLWQHSHIKREVSMFGLFWFGTDQFTDLRSLIKLSLWNFQKSLFRVFTYRVLAIMPKKTLILLLHAFTDTLIIIFKLPNYPRPILQKLSKELPKKILLGGFNIVDWEKRLSLISNRHHLQRFSPSQISDTPWAAYDSAQLLSLNIV